MQTRPTPRRLPDAHRVRLLAATALVTAAALALVGAASAPASAPERPRVTLIGDSVMASFDHVPAARRMLGRGLDVRTDSAVCRRLVTVSCSFRGETPVSALDVVRARGQALGSVVVVNVGYNDWPEVYDVDRVARALRAAGVERTIWVTLREAGVHAARYAQSNARLRAAARKWEHVVVADWNAHSRQRPWFRSDGLHLTPAGANGLARLLRPLVVAAARPRSSSTRL